MIKNQKATKRIWEIAACMLLFLLLFISLKTSAFAQLTGTVTSASANVRKEASTSSTVIAGLSYGDEVSIAGETTDSDGNLWYQIHVDADTKGYVAASLITKDGDSAPVTNDTPSSTTTTTTTTTSDTGTSADYIDSEDQWKSATISSSSVRVRAGASTSTDVLATVTQGVVLTVTGSKQGDDGYEWHQVSFRVDGEDYLGFIRSDLITFDNAGTDEGTTVSGTIDPNDTDAESEVEATPTEAVEETTEETVETTELVTYDIVATDQLVQVPSGYLEVPFETADGGETSGWKNGDFYIIYARSSDGKEGWYRYDNVSDVYQRYVESESVSLTDSETKSSSSLLVYILIGAVVILFVLCLILLVRVSDMRTDMRFDEEDEDEDEGENLFEDRRAKVYTIREEDEDEDEEPYHVKRPIRRNQDEDRRIERELEEVLEQELVREEKTSMKSESKVSYEEDPEEYLKPDDDESWDDEFDFIDLD